VIGLIPMRDLQLVPLLIGILRAGSAYMAIDPSFPASRVETMLTAVSVPFVLVAPAFAGTVGPERAPVSIDDLLALSEGLDPFTADVDPEDTACVLFTSGSTGTPKAVAIKHRGLTNVCSWASHAFTDDELARVPVTASLNFDFSTFEVFTPLASGGCLVMVDNVLSLRDHSSEFTLLATVPTALRLLLDAGAIPGSVRAVVAGGERLTEDLAARIRELPQQPRLINIYGPTETTVLCSAAEVGLLPGPPPIGKPIDGAVLLVMDRVGCPLPPGYVGELWVGGAGLSAGYLGEPQLSHERFVEAELPGIDRIPMYRTGDLVVADSDGDLQYRGRIDDQMKVRGMRIEPGEIEATLLAYPGVESVAVFAVGEGAERELHAAIVESKPLDIDTLGRFAEQHLPRYMVPRRYRILDQLPLTAHGKTDRRALERADPESAPIALPSGDSEAEALLGVIWSRLLRTTQVDVDADFFEAGGNSLLALEMLIEVERCFNVRLPLTWLIDGPASIRRLSQELRVAAPNPDAADSTSPLVVPLRVAGRKPPLFLLYADAQALLSARFLVPVMATDRPLYAIAPNWTSGSTVRDSIDAVAAAIDASAVGPVHLVGHSIGGEFAYEIAAQRMASGRPVGAVVLVDTIAPAKSGLRHGPLSAVITSLGRLIPTRSTGRYRFDFAKVVALMKRHPRPKSHAIRVDLLTTEPSRRRFGPLLGWEAIHQGPLTWHSLPGNHLSMLRADNLAAYAEVIERCATTADDLRTAASP